MTTTLDRITFVAALLVAALFGSQATAQANRASFPENFDENVLYATYDRGTAKEEAFALPETIEASKAGLPLPPGTRLVLGIWNDDALTDYFVMEKGEGWGLDFAEEHRTGDWHFQQFDPDGQVRRTAFAERCQSCHQGPRPRTTSCSPEDRMRAYLP